MSENRPCVLNIEDDEDIALVVRTVLERAGYRVLSAVDGREGLRCFHDERPDLVILDVGLPSLDGWTLIERVRDLSSAPILMLSALSSEPDKVRGLTAGADDYLTKPFGNSELVARVEALLRRGAEGSRRATGRGGPVIAEHGIEVDLEAHLVRSGGRDVELTPTEFRLLETLMTHRDKVLSPEQLLQQAWRDPTATGPDRVKFAVLRLRRKLGWANQSGDPIETVRGFGYRYRSPEARQQGQS
ncbi:MAG: response regulator transcription factor [Acidimicrobiales bacterium]